MKKFNSSTSHIIIASLALLFCYHASSCKRTNADKYNETEVTIEDSTTKTSMHDDFLTDTTLRSVIQYNVFLQIQTKTEPKELTLSKSFNEAKFSFVNRQQALWFLNDLAINCIKEDLNAISKQMEYDIPEFQSYALAVFAELPDESLMLYGMGNTREQMNALKKELQYYIKTTDPYDGELEVFVLEENDGGRPEVYFVLPASSYEDYTIEAYQIKKFTFSKGIENTLHWSHLEDFSILFPLKNYPDDLQVIVFDGPYREYKPGAEFMWIRTLGVMDNYYIGSVLNHPKKLEQWKRGDLVIFKIANGENGKPMIVSPEQLMNTPE